MKWVLVAMAVVAELSAYGSSAFGFERVCAYFPFYYYEAGWLHVCDGYETANCEDEPQLTFAAFPTENYGYDCSQNPPENCLTPSQMRASSALNLGQHPPLTAKISSLGEPGFIHRAVDIDLAKSVKVQFIHRNSERNGGRDEPVYIRILHLKSKVNGRTLVIGYEYQPNPGDVDPIDVSNRVHVDKSQAESGKAYLFRYAPNDGKEVLFVKQVPKALAGAE